MFLHENLLIGGLPAAGMVMEMSSPSITVKFPGEAWNSGGTGKDAISICWLI